MSKIYAAAAIIFGAIAAIFSAFMAGGKSKENKINSKLSEQTRKADNKASDAAIAGKDREQEIRHAQGVDEDWFDPNGY